jgi:glycosyltransferase
LISVVTAVFNGARSLEATLLSVQTQTYPDIEHWVIDAASTDGTVDIIKRHASRLAGWISEPDGGIADGFNKGVDRGRGDYIMFLSADDALAHPRALEDLIAYARANGWPDAVYGDCDLCDPVSGEVLYRVMVDYDRARFLRGGIVPHPGMLMHRRYFERYGKFDTSFRVAMDYELFLRGIPQTGALRLPELVTNIGAGGVSARNRKMAVAENIRALRMHGYLNAFSEARLRAVYAARGAARRLLEVTGLYHGFDAVRRRKAREAARRPA